MRLPTFDKTRLISRAQDSAPFIAPPRGCLDETLELLSSLRIEAALRDERFSGTPFTVHFHGELRPEQQLAANALAAHDTGVLAAPTGFRRTVIAARLIGDRRAGSLG